MIIVTRPSPYGENLTQLCLDANLAAIHLPLFKIVPGHDLNSLPHWLMQLQPNDIVVIVSPQIIHLLTRHHPNLTFPSYLRYFAVGAQTANLFNQLTGNSVMYPHEHENSEGLIALLQQQSSSINNTRAYILCGNVGRNLILNTLTALGATVQRIYCYERIAQPYFTTVLSQDIDQQIIIITSVEHLYQLDKLCGVTHKQHSRLIVSVDRVYQQAKILGWQHIIMSDGANNQNLFKTITSLCHNA